MLQPHRKVSCLTTLYTKKSGKWLLFLLILRSESLFSGSYNIPYYYTLKLWTFHYKIKKSAGLFTLCGCAAFRLKFLCRPWMLPWWSYPCIPSCNPPARRTARFQIPSPFRQAPGWLRWSAFLRPHFTLSEMLLTSSCAKDARMESIINYTIYWAFAPELLLVFGQSASEDMPYARQT